MSDTISDGTEKCSLMLLPWHWRRCSYQRSGGYRCGWGWCWWRPAPPPDSVRPGNCLCCPDTDLCYLSRREAHHLLPHQKVCGTDVQLADLQQKTESMIGWLSQIFLSVVFTDQFWDCNSPTWASNMPRHLNTRGHDQWCLNTCFIINTRA